MECTAAAGRRRGSHGLAGSTYFLTPAVVSQGVKEGRFESGFQCLKSFDIHILLFIILNGLYSVRYIESHDFPPSIQGSIGGRAQPLSVAFRGAFLM